MIPNFQGFGLSESAYLFCTNWAAPLDQALPIQPSLTKTLETPVRILKSGSLVAGKYRILHEVGDEEERSFIAMEYVERETLRDRIKKGSLNAAEALNIVSQVAAVSF